MLASLVHRSTSSRYNELHSTGRLVATALTCSRGLSSLPTDLTDAAHTLSPMPMVASPTAMDIQAAAGPFLGTFMSAIDSLHTASGLPWWATITAVGFGVRTAMLPVSLKGLKASAALFPLLRQARGKQQQLNGEEESNSNNNSPAKMMALGRRFHELRLQQGAPHPFWIIGSPLVQLPLFITSMAAIRGMAVQGWPGFSSGGVAWFPNLTLPAMDLTSLTAPMGMEGAILPVAIAASMYANIDAAFGNTERSATTVATSSNEQQPPPPPPPPPSMMVWMMGKVRLALEWAVVPLFITALQLPQGSLCYWATSSAYALAQSHILKSQTVREKLGLSASRKNLSSSHDEPQKSLSNNNRNNNDTTIPEDALQGFAKAAELRATGDFPGAAAALEDILKRHPDQSRALFALGQVRSGLKDWGGAAHVYLQAARGGSDPAQQCRAWFGAGVALHMQGREEDAVEAFTLAAGPAAGDQLRVRAWVAGATLQEKLGRRAAAVELLRRAAKIEPTVEEVYLNPLLEGKMGPGNA